jgi:NAD(P)-dependent dehydrogenase (short-subunit alcohol dehydrogenase family)
VGNDQRRGVMKVEGAVAVVTGGAGGIGAALARRLVDAGARVVVADLDGRAATAVAGSIGTAKAVGATADISSTDDLRELLALAEDRFGPVDFFFANAGIAGEQGLGESEAEWQRIIEINVMAHVRAARLLIPGWIARGSGYFVATASAAGLLTQIGTAPYAVTKHAAVAFSEWLSVTYGAQGIRVSCLCPMGVNTKMLNDVLEAEDQGAQLGARAVAHAGDVLEPADVAECVLEAIQEERFLILPHPQVREFMQRKAADPDRWLRGMRRLQGEVSG